MLWPVQRCAVGNAALCCGQCSVVLWAVQRCVVGSAALCCEQWCVVFWAVVRCVVGSGALCCGQCSVVLWAVQRCVVGSGALLGACIISYHLECGFPSTCFECEIYSVYSLSVVHIRDHNN